MHIHRLKTPMLSYNVDLTSYIDGKALFLELASYHRDLNLHTFAVSELCKIRRQILLQTLLLARTHPNPVAQIFRNSQGLIGIIRGSVLFTVRCLTVPVTIRGSPNYCYQEIPIWLGDKPAFVNPETLVIQYSAEQVACSSHLPPLHFIDGTWISFFPNITNVTSVPIQLAPDSSPDLHLPVYTEVGNAGLYDQALMRDLQYTLLFGSVRTSLVSVMTHRILSEDADSFGFSTVDIFSFSDISRLADSLFSGVFGFAEKFGRWASIFVSLTILVGIFRAIIAALLSGQLLQAFAHCGVSLITSIQHVIGITTIDNTPPAPPPSPTFHRHSAVDEFPPVATDPLLTPVASDHPAHSLPKTSPLQNPRLSHLVITRTKPHKSVPV